MHAPGKFTCFMIGTESHLIQSAEILLRRGHQIFGIISSNTVIKKWAHERGIPGLEPASDLIEVLSRKSFDYLFSITYLSIISKEILALPRKGAINFHDGPLPRYAGLHATSWALINQEKTHGVTWHIMDAEADKGDILKQRFVEIVEDDTAFTLNAKCYEAGIDSFAELVDELAGGNVDFCKQNLAEHTYYSKYQRPPAACTLFWDQPANEIAALVRALDFGRYANPLGCPKMIMGNEVFIVTAVDVLNVNSNLSSGTITAIDDNSLQVATASNVVALRNLLTINGQSLSIANFIEKCGVKVGEKLAILDQETAARLTRLNREICRYEEYWINRLATLGPIELPYADYSANLSGPSDYKNVPMRIPIEVSTFLAEHADMANLGGDFLTAAFAAYLARHSGNYSFDLAFSHPALRRKVNGFEIFYATHVPLHIELDPQMALGTAVDTVKEKCVAFVKKHETFARDVTLRYPEFRPLRENGNRPSLSIAVEQVESIGDYSPLLGSALTLLLSEDGTECRWVYDGAIFDKESITSMQRQFSIFLQKIVTHKDLSVAATSLLTDAEYHQLIIEWNNTKIDYPRHHCIHHLFENQANLMPDAVAVVFEDRQLTYRQLNCRANQLARYLRKLGVDTETRVGIYIERGLEMVVGVLGILKAGGAYLPLDHTYPAERIAFMLEDARVPVLLTISRLIKDLPAHKARVVCLDADWKTISTETEDNVYSGVAPHNLSYLIYTSGSTGKPKGVMVCHGNVVNFFAGMDRYIPYQPAGVWLAVTSLSFDISVLELFWTLSHGFKIVIYADKSRSLEPAGLHEPVNSDNGAEHYSLPGQIRHHNITHFQCTPALAGMLLTDEEARASFRSIKTFMVGGEALPVALATQLKQAVSGNVINMYGPTETTIWSTIYPVNNDQSSIPIGRPIANTEIYILDRNLLPAPIGVAGELYIGGEGVTRGYLNRPELTTERFIKHPFNDACSARLYRTGDLARYRPDGNIEFLGRIDNQVKIRGFRIELGEIETLLERNPAVRQAVVVAREDVPGDKRLVAYIVPDGDQTPSVSMLRQDLKEKLPEYMVPNTFVVLDKFPLTPNGKIDRRSLPVPTDLRPALESAYVAPRTAIERMITVVWQEVLHLEKVGVNDNFFDLGGNSLLMAQVHGRLREKLKKDLSMLELFKYPTLHSLAVYISGKSGHLVPEKIDDRMEKLQEGKNRLKQRLQCREVAEQKERRTQHEQAFNS